MPQITIPQPSQPQQRKLELNRTTKVKKEVNGEQKEFTIVFDDLVHGETLGRGQYGTVKKMYHQESDMTFAVKMIDDNIVETSNDKRNSELMDLEVSKQIGDGCQYLLKFYGALHADVTIIFLKLLILSISKS